MAPGRQLEAEKAGAAAGIERIEVAAPREDEIEDAVLGSALRGSADAVAEVLVEVRCPPIPVGGDLLLDRVCLAGDHLMSLPPLEPRLGGGPIRPAGRQRKFRREERTARRTPSGLRQS
jgi:hypothetical protein